MQSQEEAFVRFTEKIKHQQFAKFNKLKSAAIDQLGISDTEKWFVNQTNVTFPHEVRILLALGKKFALPYSHKDLPLLQIIADGEYCIQMIEDDRIRDITRSKLCNLISNFRLNIKAFSHHKLIRKMYEDAVKFLKTHKEIVILSADKGNVTVAMYKNDYIDKINSVLADQNTFMELRTDPTSSCQAKNNEIIRQLFNLGYINGRNKHNLITYKAQPPKLYGLPKIHKENCPIRPIVASVNSPTYFLSKFLASILGNLTVDSKYNIKNSHVFKDKISKTNIHNNEKMVSFDVVSLFTNIPVQLCIEIIAKNWEKVKIHTNIPKKKFMDMLSFCIVDNNYFVFNNKAYRQVFGLPMGSPLSPILADIVMEDLLDVTLMKLQQRPKLMCKYVDDLFAIILTSEIDKTLLALNGYHDRLKFTVEFESNNSLPYLDVRVIREDNNLITDWYQKPTSSGRLINYYSCHPHHQKINTARNFINGVLGICDKKFDVKNTLKIKEILGKNGYPKNITSSLLWQYKNRRKIPVVEADHQISNNSEPKLYRSATYVPVLSEKIERTLKGVNDRVCLAFKSGISNRNIFSKLKQKTEKEKTSDVVYKIPCAGKENDDCSLCYVGTTGQLLKNRMSNHKSDIKNKSCNKTALAAHCIAQGHTPDFDKTEILTRERNWTKRQILESLHIYCTSNTMNKKTDTDNINVTYCSILESCVIKEN